MARNYIRGQKEEFKISRSKVEMYMKCKRCFYLEAIHNISPPPGFPFNLNSAVDALFKKEFDIYRAEQKPHPLFKEFELDPNIVPFQHSMLDKWRHNFTGVQRKHEPTNFLCFGAVDDLWVNLQTDEIIVCDYKATSKDTEITLDAEWQNGYKRQMEFYQWLLRGQGFKVADTGYFCYANGSKREERFNDTLKFKTKLIPYTGNDSWVEPMLQEILDTLNAGEGTLSGQIVPANSPTCEYCAYIKKRYTIKL